MKLNMWKRIMHTYCHRIKFGRVDVFLSLAAVKHIHNVRRVKGSEIFDRTCEPVKNLLDQSLVSLLDGHIHSRVHFVWVESNNYRGKASVLGTPPRVIELGVFAYGFPVFVRMLVDLQVDEPPSSVGVTDYPCDVWSASARLALVPTDQNVIHRRWGWKVGENSR